MSLDVYLTLPGEPMMRSSAGERIYVRRGGATVEISRAEWEAENPGREPVTMVAEVDERQVYEANITHNMDRMASQVGLYEPLWRPDEIGIERAGQLVEPLRDGLARLRDEHERLQEFNPANGWGNYELLVSFTEDYLAACERWPDAEVEVSR